MATEHEIRAAEVARLEAIVAEHGTEREQFQLVLSGAMRNGISLAQFEGTEPLGYLPPEPELLARLARRAERRAKLGLPAAPCAGDPPTRHGCNCLDRALDEPGNGGKRHVLKRAAALHWKPPPPRPMPTPKPKAEPKAPTRPASPKPTKPEPEPPPRIVARTRRWYDRPEGAVGFSEMKF